ncbi:hypothetical protein ElyMa_001853900 [Elysia marginata]|uniref:Uncharacterized protein n=1 Tax=Elysia marginata TaxID=1093978 RepID=A0AAV4EM71_9GAST|nr:hypothetical protein ElyMa_001853900 [Elysia marginata]
MALILEMEVTSELVIHPTLTNSRWMSKDVWTPSAEKIAHIEQAEALEANLLRKQPCLERRATETSCPSSTFGSECRSSMAFRQFQQP